MNIPELITKLARYLQVQIKVTLLGVVI